MSSTNNNATKSGNGEEKHPKDLSATDWAILKHVSLYNLTIRHAVEKLFFAADAAKAGTALDALARQGYLKNREDSKPNRPKPKQAGKNQPDSRKVMHSDETEIFKIGSIKYYLLGNKSKLLAPMGFRFPKERFVPPSTEQSFYKHLSALWFCLFEGPRRYRLDQEELTALWKDAIPQDRKIPHQPAYCLANEAQEPVVYRLYPTRKDRAAQIIEEVRKKLENDANNLGLQHVLESGEYGYAIIVPSQDRKRDVERELVKLRKQRPLLASARITVHQAPTPPLLPKALGDGG